MLPDRRTPLGGMRITSRSSTPVGVGHREAERQAGVTGHRAQVADRDALVVVHIGPPLQLGIEDGEIDRSHEDRR